MQFAFNSSIDRVRIVLPIVKIFRHRSIHRLRVGLSWTATGGAHCSCGNDETVPVTPAPAFQWRDTTIG